MDNLNLFPKNPAQQKYHYTSVLIKEVFESYMYILMMSIKAPLTMSITVMKSG
jgi:hypothetical protein